MTVTIQEAIDTIIASVPGAPDPETVDTVKLGHAVSEEPGMRVIIPWLQEGVPGVPIQFVPTGSPFQYI